MEFCPYDKLLDNIELDSVQSMQISTFVRMGRAVILRQSPNYLIAFVNGNCNLHCDYCFKTAVDARRSREMSQQQWGETVKECRALIHVTITGGEPFLRNDLAQVIQAIARSSGAPRFTINTNGFYTERILSFLGELSETLPAKTELTLSVSLEGPNEVHDKLRNFRGSAVKARNTVQSVSEFRKSSKRKFGLRVASVLQPDNRMYLMDLMKETRQWDIDFHEIIMLRDVSPEIQCDLVEDYEKLIHWQFKNLRPSFGRSVDSLVFKHLGGEVLERIKNPKAGKCTAGTNLVEVLPDGRVLGCEMSKVSRDSTLGWVGEGRSLSRVLDGAASTRFRTKVAANCQCSFECANMSNLIFDPRRWLRFLS